MHQSGARHPARRAHVCARVQRAFQPQTIALDEIISDEYQNASTAVVAEGRKACTEAKKDTWGNFDAASLLATLVKDAAAGWTFDLRPRGEALDRLVRAPIRKSLLG